ncbi:MAG: YicC family protein [Clostridia bacterium]|nr:YicC family protein [Clostridia bacterium]
MLRSMTAFGRATGSAEGKNFVCEIKSVNNRYFDCSVKLPRSYGFLEEKVISFMKGSGISRGKLDVYIGVEVTESVGAVVELDTGYAEAYVKALRKLRDTMSLSDDISTMSVAQNRDVFIVKKPEEDIERDWEMLLPVLTEALSKYNASREKEGANLRADLILKKEKLVSLTKKIAEISEKNIASYRERLEARLKQTLEGLDIQFDSNRILTECAIFADKIAIDEEMVRLSSHFTAFDEAMNGDEPVGRRLDFLLQEMNREVNTSGSKSNDAEIAALVVEVKCELEKIREQIQNLE